MQLQRLIMRFPEKSFFIGHDEIYLSALAVGVKAGIGSTFNIMAEKFIEMNHAFAQSRLEQALQLQNEVNDVISVLCKVGVFKGIKEILRMQGIDCGACRKPFQPLKPSEIDMLRTVAERCNLLKS